MKAHKTKISKLLCKYVVKLKRSAKKLHKKISKNKFLNSELLRRTVVIAFFLGLSGVLGLFFIENQRVHLPTQIVEVLDETGFIEKEVTFLSNEILEQELPKLDPQVIFELLNTERTVLEVAELNYSEELASAAALLLVEAEKLEYDLEDRDFLPELKAALEAADYNYSHVSHNMVIGPMLEQAIVDAWFSDERQVTAIKESNFIDVGFATEIIDLEGVGTVGVVVQVLGRPMSAVQPVSQQAVTTQPKYPEISNDEVLEALNRYRAAHTVPELKSDPYLCSYAYKRLQDLIAFGGLDDHAGFRKDFEDPDNLPEAVQYYSGDKIAENLAHQNCKNMQTGESFIAETGTAIIEWCFDSSTKGHREAQLNREFKHACVRHANNMYVVMFGN